MTAWPLTDGRDRNSELDPGYSWLFTAIAGMPTQRNSSNSKISQTKLAGLRYLRGIARLPTKHFVFSPKLPRVL